MTTPAQDDPQPLAAGSSAHRSASPAEILRRARARIADPAAWSQATYARDAVGRPVSAQDPTACRWCSAGAIYAEPGSDGRNRARDLLGVAARGMGGCVVDINDTRDHATVLRMFDDAIASAEAT